MKETKPSDAKRISGGVARVSPEEHGLDPMPIPRAEPNDIDNSPIADPMGVAPRTKL
jgi:hypothetical protein